MIFIPFFIWLHLRENVIAMIEVKIKNDSAHPLPAYKTSGAAGMDLTANLQEPILLKPLERKLIKTGLSIELPVGYEAQVRPRSGLAAKYGITVLNSPGTIDADYRGEIGVILVNLSNTFFTIQPRERIAQLVVTKFEKIDWLPTNELSATQRGDGGFGSTGNK